MPNVFNYIKPKARLDKNGFDLSHRSVFSCKAGALYPVLAYDMVPNDFVEVNVNDLLRTATLETAAFARMKQNFEFYFVPYSQLWKNFNEMIAQRRDPVSANSKSSVYNPVVPLKKLVTMAVISAFHVNREVWSDFYSEDYNIQNDIHGYNWGYNTIRLLDLFGYGNYLGILDEIWSQFPDGNVSWDAIAGLVDTSIANTTGEELYVNIWPFLAYQKVWSDFYRNPWRDTEINEYAFNVDDVPCDSLENADVISYRTAQNTPDADGVPDVIGMFGDIFAQRYHQWKKDLFSASLPNAQFGDVATVQITNIAIDGDGGVSEDGNGDSNDDGILFDPANYEVRVNGSHSHEVLSPTAPGSVSYNYLYGAFVNFDSKKVTLHYEPEGSGTTHLHDLDVSGDYTFNGTIVEKNRSAAGIAQRRRALNNLVISTAQDVAAFSVYDLKRAEMLQRWSEITMRSGYRTLSLFEGHFGVSPRYEQDNHPAFLGSFDSVIQINDVTATAQTDGVKLGELAAKGVSVQNGHIRYQSNDFGILLCMYYIQPEVEYNSFGLSKHRMKCQPFDYFTPEFEDLGFEPVLGGQLNMLVGLNSMLTDQSTDFVNKVIGYAPRYAEYKTDYDKVHGLFSETYVVEKNNLGVPTGIRSVLGQFSHWVSAHESAQLSLFENLKDFYIDPNVLNNIFAIEADSKQDTDQFIVNCYFDIKAVRPMSVLGLPNW